MPSTWQLGRTDDGDTYESPVIENLTNFLAGSRRYVDREVANIPVGLTLASLRMYVRTAPRASAELLFGLDASIVDAGALGTASVRLAFSEYYTSRLSRPYFYAAVAKLSDGTSYVVAYGKVAAASMAATAPLPASFLTSDHDESGIGLPTVGSYVDVTVTTADVDGVLMPFIDVGAAIDNPLNGAVNFRSRTTGLLATTVFRISRTGTGAFNVILSIGEASYPIPANTAADVPGTGGGGGGGGGGSTPVITAVPTAIASGGGFHVGDADRTIVYTHPTAGTTITVATSDATKVSIIGATSGPSPFTATIHAVAAGSANLTGSAASSTSAVVAVTTLAAVTGNGDADLDTLLAALTTNGGGIVTAFSAEDTGLVAGGGAFTSLPEYRRTAGVPDLAVTGTAPTVSGAGAAKRVVFAGNGSIGSVGYAPFIPQQTGAVRTKLEVAIYKATGTGYFGGISDAASPAMILRDAGGFVGAFSGPTSTVPTSDTALRGMVHVMDPSDGATGHKLRGVSQGADVATAGSATAPIGTGQLVIGDAWTNFGQRHEMEWKMTVILSRLPVAGDYTALATYLTAKGGTPL